MAMHDLVHDTESTEYFPHPSMPDSSCTLQLQNDGYMETENEAKEVNDYITSALRECFEEIDSKVKELFKKIVSNGDMEIPLGRVAREAMGEFGAKDLLENIMKKVGKIMKARNHKEFVVANRGLSIDEDLNLKLERFKVKTVNIGGVVEEDNK